MDELKIKLLEKLKKLKGISDDKLDDAFLFGIETAINDVLNYCSLEIQDIPESLHNTIILIAIDLLNEGGYLLSDEEKSDGGIKSLTEGDFSISKETLSESLQKMASAPSFSRKYQRNLNNFRKLPR